MQLVVDKYNSVARRPTRPSVPLCLLVVVAAPDNGPGEPLVWNDARAKCGEANGALAVIDNHDKLQLLSKFIDEKYPAETKGGWTLPCWSSERQFEMDLVQFCRRGTAIQSVGTKPSTATE
ncbi:hypothetical protein C7M84_007301 [Penaeus vannamei]|uniref:C-type lectin domain-containing protein n=1 Tax=Penaeus vannamei TaxID=6689 RepID=A0A3R7M7J7_PENVA|nr:hypothetical protein C7M84_007301 [Penaeus vannamei]